MLLRSAEHHFPQTVFEPPAPSMLQNILGGGETSCDGFNLEFGRVMSEINLFKLIRVMFYLKNLKNNKMPPFIYSCHFWNLYQFV
jgi:hypothetical protein